jgi:hypothetical protein
MYGGHPHDEYTISILTSDIFDSGDRLIEEEIKLKLFLPLYQ